MDCGSCMAEILQCCTVRLIPCMWEGSISCADLLEVLQELFLDKLNKINTEHAQWCVLQLPCTQFSLLQSVVGRNNERV